MQVAGKMAAAACTVQLSIAISRGNQNYQSRLFKSPCHALERRLRNLQQRIYSQSLKPNLSTDAEDIDTLHEDESIEHRWLRLAAAFLAAVCLHLGSSQVADALNLASAAEDQLLSVFRVLETQIESARTSIGSAAGSLVAPSPSDVEAEKERMMARDLINEVFEVVDRNFADARGAGFDSAHWRELRDAALSRPLPNVAAAHNELRKMISQLKDPYSRFITPDEFAAMIKYDVSGVGLNLGSLEEMKAKTGLIPASIQEEEDSVSSTVSTGGGVWVVGLIRGSAAETAGMRQGDEILAADGQPVVDRTPFAVASLLQGPELDDSNTNTIENSTNSSTNIVSLKVRHLDGSVEELTLARPPKPVTPSPVTGKLEETGNVGYIRLKNFNARAQRDVASAVRSMHDAGAERFVLDLRGNRGGLVSEGVEVARLFLQDQAVVVRTEGSKTRSNVPMLAPGPALSNAPLAVLVDGHTASASEILAGALQDNCRAVLVGRRTYGKGLIQSVYELGDGSGLVLTVGKYLTPLGRDIDLDGIVPDFGSMPSPAGAEEALSACRLKAKL